MISIWLMAHLHLIVLWLAIGLLILAVSLREAGVFVEGGLALWRCDVWEVAIMLAIVVAWPVWVTFLWLMSRFGGRG